MNVTFKDCMVMIFFNTPIRKDFTSQIVIKHTPLKNKIKLWKRILVSLATVPTISNNSLVEINPYVTELGVKIVCSIYLCCSIKIF